MTIAYYIGKEELCGDAGVLSLLGRLEHGRCGIYRVKSEDELRDGTDMLLSFGGDGSFLSSSHIVARKQIPLLGVNMGRLGFLSENGPGDVADAILNRLYRIEERELLQVSGIEGEFPYALNEISVSRVNAAMLGVNVRLNSEELPTFWADGVLVSTSSGSTAYSLSVGGPICTPDAKVIIIAPISPHNLNLRPLVVPQNASIGISLKARDAEAALTIDNHTYSLPSDADVVIKEAPVRLRKVCLDKSNFIDALRTRLFWGEDVRNTE
ncbi:MAG: NAD(+)/NADH kinase [Bacteroidales bacterium]|nr:NAD(+)/NADH kinase [Bacteroidales bacterium]